MRISWNWLSELVDLSGLESPAALAELLTNRGLEVEGLERQDHGLEKVVTAQILERKPHPQADRLSLCSVTVGTGEPLEIVCGAQNMKAGDKVALAQVGAHLPNGLKISAGKIRGVVSHGMLCSEEELKFKESSEGILILPPSTPLGQPLAKVLGRDDTILTLKLTSNRGDCLSHFGIAREIGAALNRKPQKPSFLPLEFKNSPISVELDAGAEAPQFLGCSIRGVKVGPSPEWLVRRLEALGNRSINNVVDATNWVLLELGHPMHAYDAKKILGNKIRVRMAREGESLPLLDGQTVVLSGTELVISDEERAVALAGVMGGGNSEVSEETQELFLECAEFSPAWVRRAAVRHQRRTEAAHRFERGVDPQGLPQAIGRLAELIVQLAGGQVIGAVSAQVAPQLKKPAKNPIHFGIHYLTDFLGFDRANTPLTPTKTAEILKALDCDVTQPTGSGDWQVLPPSYRLDLNIKEDLAEEVARSLGYDQLPATIPPLSGSPVFGASSLPRWELLKGAKQSLVQSGLHEALNFAFTSKAWLSRFEMTSSVLVSDPLSEEHEAMVPSLIPGLVKNTLNNWNHHFGSEPLAIRLFEIRPVFSAAATGQTEDQRKRTGIEEHWRLALVLSGPRYSEALRSERGEVDFYDLKGVIDNLLAHLGARGVRYQPLSASKSGGHPLFHPGQSVEVLAGNSVLGTFGLFHPERLAL